MFKKLLIAVVLLAVFIVGSFVESLFNITSHLAALFSTVRLLAGDLYSRQLAGQSGDINIVAILVALGGFVALLSFKYLTGKYLTGSRRKFKQLQ